MSNILIVSFLFFVGSMFGYLLEVFYRRFFSAKKWINPGFLVGPYIPLYGFGLIIYYLLSKIDLSFIENELLRKALLIVIMGFSVTLLEYLIGIISIKVTNVRLWDYSDRKFNIQGIICPLFTFFWIIIALIYITFVDPRIEVMIDWFKNNIAFSFVVGMFYGIFIIDLCYSIRIIDKIKRFAKENDIIIKYENMKVKIKNERERRRQKYSFLFPFRDLNVKEHLEEYKKDLELLKIVIDDKYEL